MILKIKGENQDYDLVQLSDYDFGEQKGLYLVPVGNLDLFEEEIKSVDDQDEFDENNSCGAIRIMALDSALTLNF